MYASKPVLSIKKMTNDDDISDQVDRTDRQTLYGIEIKAPQTRKKYICKETLLN